MSYLGQVAYKNIKNKQNNQGTSFFFFFFKVQLQHVERTGRR